jgi:hypothetical protein
MNAIVHSLLVGAGCLVLAVGLLSTLTINKQK